MTVGSALVGDGPTSTLLRMLRRCELSSGRLHTKAVGVIAPARSRPGTGPVTSTIVDASPERGWDRRPGRR